MKQDHLILMKPAAAMSSFLSLPLLDLFLDLLLDLPASLPHSLNLSPPRVTGCLNDKITKMKMKKTAFLSKNSLSSLVNASLKEWRDWPERKSHWWLETKFFVKKDNSRVDLSFSHGIVVRQWLLRSTCQQLQESPRMQLISLWNGLA